jgi:hypothetical protein
VRLWVRFARSLFCLPALHAGGDVLTENRTRDTAIQSVRPSSLDVPSLLWTAWMLWAASTCVGAHSGPPFPIVTEQRVGAYAVAVWTDPDATDDGSAAGQFWVVLREAGTGNAAPESTRIEVSIRPTDRGGGTRTQRTEPVKGDATRQFAALVMDHEGPFGVRVSIDGPLGKAELAASVDATYDLRPAPATIVLYLMPFLFVGFLWGKLLLRRRCDRRRKMA